MTDIRFGTDGWRGIIAEDVTFASIRLVARAIARRVRADAANQSSPHILVGHDTRFLSREFARTAADAIAGEGLQVGLTSAFAPTPAYSYAVVRLGAAGAVVITASHNPPEYNGVKFKTNFGGSASIAFTRGVEEQIRAMQAEGRAPSAGGKSEIRNPKSEIDSFDPRTLWLDRLEELADVARIGRSGIRVALDVMYGAGQGLLSERLRRRGAEVRELHAELNPGFGGLHPEPIPAYLGALMDCVKSWGKGQAHAWVSPSTATATASRLWMRTGTSSRHTRRWHSSCDTSCGTGGSAGRS